MNVRFPEIANRRQRRRTGVPALRLIAGGRALTFRTFPAYILWST